MNSFYINTKTAIDRFLRRITEFLRDNVENVLKELPNVLFLSILPVDKHYSEIKLEYIDRSYPLNTAKRRYLTL